MLTSKTYVKILVTLLFAIFAGTFIYIYIYAKHYPIPLFSRISLDAKMMFIRDMTNKEDIDTIIIGSSVGLNNIQGIVLENESKKVEHVLNLSSFSLEVVHVEKIWDIILFFPNVKRVIYSAQSLDFTGESTFEITNLDFVKEYINLDPNSINLKYSFYAYKHFLQSVERHWDWEKKYMAHHKYSNIDFDRTGSAPLKIYGEDIIKRRWINPYVKETDEESYLSLARIMNKAEKDNIKFYFLAQPFRIPLLQEHKHIRERISYFQMRTQDIALKNNAYFLNMHMKLKLEDKYFADRLHLNDKGSVVATKALAGFIDANEQQ